MTCTSLGEAIFWMMGSAKEGRLTRAGSPPWKRLTTARSASPLMAPAAMTVALRGERTPPRWRFTILSE